LLALTEVVEAAAEQGRKQPELRHSLSRSTALAHAFAHVRGEGFEHLQCFLPPTLASEGCRSNLSQRGRKGLLWLTFHQQRQDPVAPPKGSKLLHLRIDPTRVWRAGRTDNDQVRRVLQRFAYPGTEISGCRELLFIAKDATDAGG
jgi:hypothetical protein